MTRSGEVCRVHFPQTFTRKSIEKLSDITIDITRYTVYYPCQTTGEMLFFDVYYFH